MLGFEFSPLSGTEPDPVTIPGSEKLKSFVQKEAEKRKAAKAATEAVHAALEGRR